MKTNLRRWRRTVSLFLLAIFALLMSNDANAAPTKYNYFLEQDTKFGRQKLYISETGIVVETPCDGRFVQYKTSDKTVTMWSEKNHLYCTLPYQKWKTDYRNIYAAATWYSDMTKPAATQLRQVNNIDHHIYKYVVGANVPDYYQSEIGKKPAQSGTQAAFLTTIDLPVYPEAASLVARLYGLPEVRGIPYGLIKPQDPGLKTTKFVANSTTPLPYFVPSAKYKKKAFNSQLFTVRFDSNMTDMMLPY